MKQNYLPEELLKTGVGRNLFPHLRCSNVSGQSKNHNLQLPSYKQGKWEHRALQKDTIDHLHSAETKDRGAVETQAELPEEPAEAHPQDLLD